MNKEKLTEEQIQWAYDKWTNEHYSLEQLGEVLGVDWRTVSNSFTRRKMKKKQKPPLKPP